VDSDCEQGTQAGRQVSRVFVGGPFGEFGRGSVVGAGPLSCGFSPAGQDLSIARRRATYLVGREHLGGPGVITLVPRALLVKAG